MVCIFIRDRHDNPLPESDLDVKLDGVLFAKFKDTEGRVNVSIPGSVPHQSIELTAYYRDEKPQRAKIGPQTDAYTFHFDVNGQYSNFTRHILTSAAATALLLGIIIGAFYLGVLSGLVPLVLGSLLLIAALGLAFKFPKPTVLQAQLIRSTFALAAGGLASHIPGMLNVGLGWEGKAAISAAGALAVYVIVFFFTPARDPP
ncbi:hypothetical protein [Mesorhizobium sp. M1E.F.Ca.ET.063.01.1.1]|uniref:hypothetical protein n=1 Tax=Mesorhizobium sp. M1E.F.Ca.ET.063.01.1.1 TaxID=2496750 RepID=UPI000FCBFC07|nr:hypothetical protein [Mesorhizobium sp. M1E.F.Ca.ET.063.01.1.1]RUW85201.1 hypothetical protein EOA29_05985 [Mesorhizobium sp. M1E.F.Ca.ET.063.01.1.1]